MSKSWKILGSSRLNILGCEETKENLIIMSRLKLSDVFVRLHNAYVKLEKLENYKSMKFHNKAARKHLLHRIDKLLVRISQYKEIELEEKQKLWNLQKSIEIN